MANTVIALKKSATPSSVPADLANGELAINYADGKLYYKAANGTIAAISGNEPNYFGTVNANNTLVVADTPGDVFTLASGNNIAITGDAINDKITVALTNDVTLPGTLTLGAVGGDEGGELKLANALTNSVLSGKVVIDIYQNKLRFYEESGTNRGAFIDLSAASGGVASDLLAGSSGTDTIARQWATGAFDKANNAYAQANAAYDAANNAVTDFSPAFIQANTARVHANAAFASANAGQATANAAFDKANTANITADLAFIHANAAFFKANNAVTDFSPAFNQANTARDHANASYAFANSSHIVSNLSFIHANAAFDKANTANITADLAFIHANAAFDAANNAVTDFSPAFIQANLAYAQANTARDHANAAFLSSNSVNTYSDGTYIKLIAPSQTITGNLSITGSLSISGNTYLIDAETLKVADPLIYLAGNNYVSDLVDIGFIANYVNATGQNVHTGLYREHENKEYYLFQGYDGEPDNNHIGALSNNMTLAVLNADLKTSNIILGGANAILTIGASFNHANAAHASANAGMAISNAAFAAANAGLLQANTARDHANAAFNKANTAVTDFSPAFLTANIAYAHANAAFNTANSALPNTSGAAFNGNLNLPTGNLAVGIATPNTGAKLQVYNTTGNSELWITAGNGFDPTLRLTGEAGDIVNEGFTIRYDNSVGDTYFENKFGAVTSYHFLTSVVEALTIHTDGKVGVGETNPQYILDVKGVANVSSALLVNDMNVKPTIQAAFNRANTANITADRAWNHANAAFDKANTPSGGAYYSGNNGDVGSASGLGDIFRVHTNTLNANVTIYSGNNALAAGPITVAAGKILTIQANARVAIV